MNRTGELARLAVLAERPGGGLAVVFGRRRIGKTRLLVEWCGRHGGVYAVADQSAADGQRRYLAEAVAGFSQRMMQGLVLARDAPLYGRAHELFEVPPLDLWHVTEAVGRVSDRALLEFYTAWGGVPRYWELAVEWKADTRGALDHLVLDPRGPLPREPDRLLLEEIPSALEVRPVLDAIGAGAPAPRRGQVSAWRCTSPRALFVPDAQRATHVDSVAIVTLRHLNRTG